jgi:DNA-binding IclR family transcriptional regulator
MTSISLPGVPVPRRRTNRVQSATGHTGASGQGHQKYGPYTIAVLRRAIEILSVFSHARPAMSPAEIVQAVCLPKTTVFRNSIVWLRGDSVNGMPRQESIALAFELVRLADIRRRQSNVHDVAIPVMRDIRNQVSETVIGSLR